MQLAFAQQQKGQGTSVSEHMMRIVYEMPLEKGQSLVPFLNQEPEMKRDEKEEVDSKEISQESKEQWMYDFRKQYGKASGALRFWVGWTTTKEENQAATPAFKTWLTAQSSDNGIWNLVGDIRAVDEADVWKQVASAYPNYKMRFCNQVALDYKPSDRFV